jgi:hypothetical protein
VEIYNSDPFYLDISGYRMSGAFNYTMPPNTIIPASGYLVIAPVPADLAALYNIENLIGGFEASGLGADGEITLCDEAGAWLTTIEYSAQSPWPEGSVATGHSLVLKQPSLGEVYAEAWGLSRRLGGSPGSAEPLDPHGYESLIFNEVMPHPGGTMQGFVELYNFSKDVVDLSGCVLKVDNPRSEGCVLPAGTIVAGGGYLALSESECGFYINGRGDKLFLFAPESADGVLIDAFAFDDQEAGVAYGRSPDGAPCWNRLIQPSPGAANTARLPAMVVLSEVMYHTLREQGTQEFIELHNVTSNSMPLAGWKLSGDVQYVFTTEIIPPGGFLVVPRDRAAFQILYPSVAALATGDYSGSLPNKRGNVCLERPAFVMDTNDGGAPVVKEKCVVIEQIDYRDGGDWHKLADGMGSSLERVAPCADPMLASSWRASDESKKSEWVTLEFSGKIDHGFPGDEGIPDEFHLGLLGAGECLIDSVELYEDGGANLVCNSSFEENSSDWSFMGTHDESGIVNDAAAPHGKRVLHLKASERLHTGANCVRGRLIRTMTTSGNATIRVRARWLSGSPELLIRSKGNWIEAGGQIVTTYALGTPANAPNSVVDDNAPPSITAVTHYPILPRNDEEIAVYARIADSDGLLDVRLCYRVDGIKEEYSVPMLPCTAGFCKGIIPAGQPMNALIAFYVEAQDSGIPSMAARFPLTAPARECLVRYNEPLVERSFGVYRFWVSAKNYDYWNRRQNGSNKPVDVTFVYNKRPVYAAGIMFSGSPFHDGRYTVPINSGGTIDYKLEFPGDDEVLDSGRMILASTGNLGSDNIGIKEQFNYEMVRALGLAHPRRRFVHLFANGTEQGVRKIYEDTEKPNRDYIERWFSDDPDNEIFKVDDWFEFDLEENSRANINATLQPFYSDAPDGDGEILKPARYRWNWQKRGFDNLFGNNYTNLFTLVTGLNVADATTYSRFVREEIDFDAFAGIIAMNRFICNPDSYGYSRGKNMYMYDSLSGWTLVAWDMDFQFALERLKTPMDPYSSSFPCNDPTMRRYLREPQVTRSYWRSVIKMLDAARDTSIRSFIRAKYHALQLDNTALYGSYDAHFNLVEQRCANVAAELDFLNPTALWLILPADDLSYADENVVAVRGIAPFEASIIEINGVNTPVTWLTPTTWSAQVVLNNDFNTFTFTARKENGELITGSPITRKIVYNGLPLDSMRDHLVISEIMNLPTITGAGYVEILNHSETTVMNLAKLFVTGSITFTFPQGVNLAPGECALLVENKTIFSSVYSEVAANRIAGEYNGVLPPEAGSVALRRPPHEFELKSEVLDRVDYDTSFPWPSPASPGVALQLSNPAIDSSCPANWLLVSDPDAVTTNTVVDWSADWRFQTTGFPGVAWQEEGFETSDWLSGLGPLGWEAVTVLPVPIATSFELTGQIAYYFRSTFSFENNPLGCIMLLSYMLDDGAVFYLNGTEIHRSSLMPQGAITESSAAISAKIPEGEIEGAFELATSQLRRGQNVLAVSVHQNQVRSSDLVFGMQLQLISPGQNSSSPGVENIINEPLENLPDIGLNEIQTLNVTGPVDDNEAYSPWIELYNGNTNTVSLAGWMLSVNQLASEWSFPDGTTIAANDYLLVWLDGFVAQPQDQDNLHASFRCDLQSGLVVLRNADGIIVDHLEFAAPQPDTSFGCWPDGHPHERRVLNPPTPKSTNRIEKRPIAVFVNELMADNGLFTNPLSGQCDDWFELLNDGSTTVDLAGWVITDKLSVYDPPYPDLNKGFTMPPDITLLPGEVLRIWTGADNAYSLPFDPAHLQSPFGLSKNGDTVYLFNNEMILVDTFSYEMEDDDDDSLGRWENGEFGTLTLFDVPTPGELNRDPRFGVGLLQQTTSFVIPECVPFSYTNTFVGARPSNFEFRLFATDSGDLPAGLSFDHFSGVLSWTPAEEHGPGVYEFDLAGYIVDGADVELCDHLPLTVIVEERPSLPEINPIAAVTVDEGEMVSFTVTAQRKNEIPPYQTFTNLRIEGDYPPSMRLDDQNGQITWQTTEIDGPSLHFLHVVAEDSVMPEQNCSVVVTVRVNEVNSPFIYASPDTFNLWNNENFSVYLQLDDPDLPANNFSYVLIEKPDGCTLDMDTGLLRWQPPTGYAGNVRVSFRGYDNAGYHELIKLNLNVSSLRFKTGALVVDPNGALRLQWLSKPDTYYSIEWAPSLDASEWYPVDLNTPVFGDGGTVECVVLPEQTEFSPRAFFRLKQHR